MTRSQMVPDLARRSMLLLVLTACLTAVGYGQEQPNIVWITADDMSPHIGAWGYEYAQTPHLDELAEEGVRYTNAYATNPVCSPSRSALITGLYATTTGTHNLRSTAPLPDRIRGFPAYLREAGYYTTNNVKTDYNTNDEERLIRESWNENSAQAHWRGRSGNEPFFSVFNHMATHQSRVSFLDQEFLELEEYLGRHAPAQAALPPYYPDTPTVRRTWARYNDAVTAFDARVGEILDQLETDGIADSTIVFVYSDHGMGLPRGKRTLYDSGLQVPLIVYFPEAYQHLAPAKPGQTTDRLVSFIDFPPTVLSLANIEIPDYMQGKAFLGERRAEPRSYVFGARDRIDEAIDMSRSVRTKQYLYIRNYFPHISWGAPEFYSDRAPIRQEILRLAREGVLDEAQYTYAGPSKPAEALFDVQADPHQIDNLAGSPEHEQILNRLRTRMRAWELNTRDIGFLPESVMMRWSRTGNAPLTFGKSDERYPLERILDAASLVGDRAAVGRQAQLLEADHPAVRFWAAAGLQAAGPAAHHSKSSLTTALNDSIPAVRIEAAGALLQLGSHPGALQTLTGALESERELVALRAARTLQLLGEKAAPVRATMTRVRDSLQQERDRAGQWPTQTAWYIYESLDAVLEKLTETPR